MGLRQNLYKAAAEDSMQERDFPAKVMAAARAYTDLMADARTRIDALRKMLSPAFFQSMPPHLALECCYLQLRMITEVIAVACLTAQGDIVEKKVQGVYSADAIMNALAKVNPEFYPIPERQVRNQAGQWTGHMLLEGGFIKRKDLTRLYSSLGDRLHVGSIKSRQRRQPLDINKEIRELNDALAGIVRLLEWHTIVLIDPAYQFWIEMVPADDPGSVAVRLTKTETDDPHFHQLLASRRAEIDRHGT
jgi:hypothetical protein